MAIKPRAHAREKRVWDAVWTGVRADRENFYSLMDKRFAWPFEGFIVNTARLLRAERITLERSRVLDFGCGQGRHALFFARSGFRRVSGIDISREAADQARAWARAEGYDIDVRSYDGRRMPYPNGSFDLVTCFGTFHHVPEEKQPALAREVARVIRRGGHLLWAEDGARTTRIPPGRRIGPSTYRIEDPADPEHGLVQHLLPLQRCRDLFPGFRFSVGASEFLEGEALDRGTSLWNLLGKKVR